MRYQNKYKNKRSIFWGLLKSQEMRGRVPVNRRGKNPPPAVAPIQQNRYAKYECRNWKNFTKLIIFSLSLQWWRKLFGKFAYQHFSWLLWAGLQNFAINANWWSFNFWNYHIWLHVCVIAFAILEFIQICLVVASFLQ